MTLNQLYLIAGICGVFVIPLGRWAYKKIREQAKQEMVESIKDSFIEDMATNHLPHLYDGMKLIANKLDVNLPDPPPIKYLPFDPTKRD